MILGRIERQQDGTPVPTGPWRRGRGYTLGVAWIVAALLASAAAWNVGVAVIHAAGGAR